MNKFNMILKKVSLVLILLLVGTFILPSISPFRITSVAKASSVKINKSKMNLIVGETYTLKILGTEKKITWSTNNKKIAVIDETGKVEVKALGNATITGSVSSTKYTCKISVVKTTADTLEDFLVRHYSYLKTDAENIKLDFIVEENEKTYNPYDYKIYTLYDENLINNIYDSIKYTNKQKEDLTNKFKTRQNSIGKALVKLLPDKKLYGGYFFSHYKYPSLRVGYYSYEYYTWINYDLNTKETDLFYYSIANYDETVISNFKWMYDKEEDIMRYDNN